MRDFTELLIAHETKQKELSLATVPEAFSVIAKLRPTLVNLMGSIGFAALLARALALASAELQWLKNVQISADGLFQGLDLLAEQLGRDELLQGQRVLLAQLLQLLVTFIGQKLTLQLVLEIWPALPAHDLNFSGKRR